MRPHLTSKLFTAATMTGTNVLLSPAIDTTMIDMSGFEFQWTGTPTGTFQFEVSNQYDPINNPNAVFVAQAGVFTPALANPAGGNSSQLCALSLISAIPFHYFRLRYTNSAGSGVLDVWLNQVCAS